MKAREIKEIVKKQNISGFVRVESRNVEIGEVLPESRIWIDGEPTDDTLNGTCAIDTSMLKYVQDELEYQGSVLILVAGDASESGEDIGEAIVKNAVVEAILN